MADRQPTRDRLINPTNLAGAARLLKNPKLLDEALDAGLGGEPKVTPGPDPTYDDTRRKR